MKRLLLPFTLLATVTWGHAGSAFLSAVDSHFNTWDENGDGILAVAEIERGVASPQFKGAAAAAIASLRRAARASEAGLPPLSLAAIHALVPRPQDRAKLPDLEAMFASALRRIQASRPHLLDADKASLDCLEQGKLGDCFCLAPMGALLHRNPQDMARLFHVSADGSAVTVTLGGGRALQVAYPTEAERALMASTDGTGVWVNCYEKAVGLMKRKEDDADHPTELSVVTRGGSAGTMLSILTGHEIERASCALFRKKETTQSEKDALLAEIRRQMVTTQAANRLICGGTSSGRTAAGHRPPGVRGPHAYAILGYDPKGDTVTLWDPHGDDFKPATQPASIQNGYSRSQGRMTVPLTELVQWFGGFSFETDRPLREEKTVEAATAAGPSAN